MTYRDLPGEKVFIAGQFEKEREYWLDKLGAGPVKTVFPADFQGTEAGDKPANRGTVNFQFPDALFKRLWEIANNSDSRLHVLLITGLSLLLYKYTGSRDILVGTPINKQEVEGEFLNTTLVLRNNIDESLGVRDFLMQVKQTVGEAVQNQNYPLETIPYELNLPVVEGEFPLCDIVLLLRNIQDRSYIAHLNPGMIFSFLRTADGLEGEVEYYAALYSQGTLERILKHFLYLLQEAFNHLDLKLTDVPVLTAEEAAHLVGELNRTASDYPRDRMIQQLFEQQVEKTPDNLAVSRSSQSLTYRELNDKSNRLARFLRGKGLRPNTAAAIMLESSIAVPLAVLAVLKAGGAYLPLGFEYPAQRIDFLLKDSEALLLLTRETLVGDMNLQCPLFYLEDRSLYSGSAGNLEPVNHSDSLAYIIYTSGTTGQPKGVMVKQQGLVNYICWAARTYVRDKKIDFPLYTSISFDLTVTSLFTPLITGNAIIVYGGKDKKFYIEDVIDDHRVGIVKLTPSHLKLIRQKDLRSSSLQCLIVGGENLETQLAGEIYRQFGRDIAIYNEYGPTETVVGSMIHRFDPHADTGFAVPLGSPIANTRVYLLNSHLQPVPVGVEGEIYIAGDGLAAGYLHNPGLSDEKFIADPFSPGRKMYRSGDLGVRRADGNLEFKGRIDHQVKIRGYRVETGEIETKIVDFQRLSRARREQKENIVEKLDLKSITRCKTCLIPVNYPGNIRFDEEGVCNICREFETYKDKALAYFTTIADFREVARRARAARQGEYDCLMLYSGGKDSSYVLHRLVDMGMKVLAFTFDNGYISKTAFENIQRTTSMLKVDHIVRDSAAMKEIFVESLWSDYNVCNGCFKAVNTFGARLAHEHNINLVISGLTRGQIFDIKLHGLFKLGVFAQEEIDERLNLFRQNYHAMTHRTSRLIGLEITNAMLEKIYFADFFKYDNITTHEILEYLKRKDKGWQRPKDTGASSSNCIINDVGIYVHLKDRGCHFYAPQLSWDCRLGTITRDEGIEELTGFQVDYPAARQVLREIGYYDAFTGAVVAAVTDEKGENALCAYLLADKEFDVTELKAHLARELPDYMIPLYYVPIDKIPLTPSGKVDRKALPKPERRFEGEYVAPRTPLEKKMVDIWSEVLGIKGELIGIDANFFEIGGHSLRATFLAADINKKLNMAVSLVKLFEKPTIRDLAQYLAESEVKTAEVIRAVEQKEYYRLSSAQSRLYVLQQMMLNTTAYNVTTMVELQGEVDREKLTGIFREMIREHESLRTSCKMVESEPVQVISKAARLEFHLECFDLEAKGGDRVEMMEEINRTFLRPFDLSQAPLLRAGLVKLHPLRFVLMVDMHHILTDYVAQALLVRNFISLFNGTPLPELRFQYKDYAEWQHSREGKELFHQQENYWRQEFQGEIPLLNLPTDFPRPVLQNFAGDFRYFELNPAETGALNEIARSEQATLFMVILALFNILLSKLGTQEEIVVGTPIIGRDYAGLDEIIGIFLNMLSLKNLPKAGLTVLEFLEALKVKTLAAYENQGYPYEDLVEAVEVKRDTSRNPLFDVTLMFQNRFAAPGDAAGPEMAGLQVKPFDFQIKSSKFDLTLLVTETGGKLNCVFEYATALFKGETILRFIRYFKNIATAVIANPRQEISGLEFLPEEEKRQLLEDFNDTGLEYARDKTLHDVFAEQAGKSPAAMAIAFEDRALTYGELERSSNRLAHYLHSEIKVQRGERVGILLDRSCHIMTAILGTLKSGAAYVPMDSTLPGIRLKHITENAEIGAVISEKIHLPILHRLQGECGTLHTILCLDSTSLAEEGEEEKNQPGLNTLSRFGDQPLVFPGNHGVRPTDLAYVIYTSGTTGVPKGIMIEHRSVINFIKGITHRIDFSPGDTILSLTTISFDIFGLEAILPLTRGSKVVIGNPEEQIDNRALTAVLVKQKVSIFQVTPSRLQMLFADDESPAALKSLTYLLVGGEAFPEPLLRRVRERFRGTIVNLYGPTETTIWSTGKDVSGENSLNIGKPLANTRIYILDRNERLLPLGAPGELCIGGDGVARGYINNESLTRRKFVANPFIPGERIYKTGDLARWLPGGDIEFLGRFDDQVKIRGFRIELGEIETRLSQHPGVKETVVVCRTRDDGDKHLCAYFAAAGEVENAPGHPELRRYLAQILPDYMIPTYFIPLDRLPLTPNGKIDRKNLPDPGALSAETEIYTSPGDESQEILVEIWAQELHVEKNSIGIDRNFFLLGGQSLKAISILARIHKRLNVRLTLADMFKFPTIRELAILVKEAAPETFTAVMAVEKREYYALSPAQKRLYVLQQLDLESTAYNLRSLLPLAPEMDEPKLKATLAKLIARHESLRTSVVMIEEKPVQRVHENAALPWEDYEVAENRLQETIRGFTRPFALSQAPLLRVGLVKAGAPGSPGTRLLLIDLHHIVTDAASQVILREEFMALYAGQRLSPLRLHYKDYSQWQHEPRVREALQKQEQYWLKEFQAGIPLLDMPLDYPRPAVQHFAGSSLGFEIGSAETRALRELARSEGVTLFMVLLAVTAILLSKLSGQEEVLIGTPSAGRRHADLEQVIGMFVNLLALRNRLSREKTFTDFLADLKARTLSAFENQDYPFEDLVDKLALKREPGRNPLVDVVFSLQDLEPAEPTGTPPPHPRDSAPPGPGKAGYEPDISKFDLMVECVNQGSNLVFVFQYGTSLYKKETIEKWMRYFRAILSAVLTDPGKRLGEIEIVSDQEHSQLLKQLKDEKGAAIAPPARTGKEKTGDITADFEY